MDFRGYEIDGDVQAQSAAYAPLTDEPYMTEQIKKLQVAADIAHKVNEDRLDALDGAGSLTIWNTAGTLVEGDLVYVSGWNEAHTSRVVAKADADAGARTQARYIVRGTIGNAAAGTVYKTHRLESVNTLGATVGDPAYLSATAAGWTLTPPTGATALQQVVGRVAVVSATVGAIDFELDAEGGPSIFGSNSLQPLSVGTAALAAAVTDRLDALEVDDAAVATAKALRDRLNVMSAPMGNLTQAVTLGLLVSPGLVTLSSIVLAAQSGPSTNERLTVDIKKSAGGSATSLLSGGTPKVLDSSAAFGTPGFTNMALSGTASVLQLSTGDIILAVFSAPANSPTINQAALGVTYKPTSG